MDRRGFLKALAAAPLAAMGGKPALADSAAGTQTQPQYGEREQALERRIRAGLRGRLREVGPKHLQRLKSELPWVLRWTPWFELLAAVASSTRRAGLRMHPGHGVLAESLCSYALGVTDIDPVRWGLQLPWALTGYTPPRFDVSIEWEAAFEWQRSLPGHIGSQAVRVSYLGNHPVVTLEDLDALADQPQIRVLRDPRLHVIGSLSRAHDIRWEPYPMLPPEVRGLSSRNASYLFGYPTPESASPRQVDLRGWTPAPIGFDDRERWRLLLEQSPRNFHELRTTAAISLAPESARPSLHQAVRDARAGRGPGSPHPAVEKLARGAYGLPVYADDTIRVAQELAGFHWREAEAMRQSFERYCDGTTEEWIGRFAGAAARHSTLPFSRAKQIAHWLFEHGGHVAAGSALGLSLLTAESSNLIRRHRRPYIRRLFAVRELLEWECRCRGQIPIPRPVPGIDWDCPCIGDAGFPAQA